MSTETVPSEIEETQSTVAQKKLLSKKVTYRVSDNSMSDVTEYEYRDGKLIREYTVSYDEEGMLSRKLNMNMTVKESLSDAMMVINYMTKKLVMRVMKPMKMSIMMSENW